MKFLHNCQEKQKIENKMKLNSNIKTAIRVAKIELNSMFYSPVAWLVLVIFGFQIGMSFAQIYGEQLRYPRYGI